MPSLRAGDKVIITSEAAVLAETPLGTRIGDVAESDAEKLRRKVILAAWIHKLDLDPPHVVLKVELG